MAAKTRWWKDGDHDAVKPYAAKTKKHDLCPECSQAMEVHGKLGGTLVHPGDYIVTLNGGEYQVHHFDAIAEALKAVDDA